MHGKQESDENICNAYLPLVYSKEDEAIRKHGAPRLTRAFVRRKSVADYQKSANWKKVAG